MRPQCSQRQHQQHSMRLMHVCKFLGINVRVYNLFCSLLIHFRLITKFWAMAIIQRLFVSFVKPARRSCFVLYCIVLGVLGISFHFIFCCVSWHRWKSKNKQRCIVYYRIIISHWYLFSWRNSDWSPSKTSLRPACTCNDAFPLADMRFKSVPSAGSKSPSDSVDSCCKFHFVVLLLLFETMNWLFQCFRIVFQDKTKQIENNHAIEMEMKTKRRRCLLVISSEFIKKNGESNIIIIAIKLT